MTVNLKNSQLLYQQIEFIWEGQKNCNLGQANYGEA